jgi:prevent-host-death family protein
MKDSTLLGASEFKAKCLGLLDEVAKGSTLIITKRGRPIAKVSPVSAPVKSLRGSWKGIVKIKGDLVKFNEAGAWENG